jgi:hypothetical protein
MTNATFVVVFCFSYETGQKTTTNAPHPCLFFFLTLQKTMTNLPTHRHLLQFKKKNTKTHKRMTNILVRYHPLQPKEKNLDVGFSWVAGDDDEPSNSSLSLCFCSSFVEDNDKLGGSSLSLGFFLICKRRRAEIPTRHCSWLFCFNYRR